MLKKYRKVLRRIIIIWLIYMAVGFVFPPLFHKKTEKDSEVGKAETEEAKPTHNQSVQERIRSIDNNMDALLWRLRLIESAKERIVLATFDFRDDNSGRDIMSSLFQAAERGVQVRILVDGINGALHLKSSKNFQALAAHENVEVKLYNPVSMIKPWINNYRMHDKYLIADDFGYILGGRNTNDLFLGNYVDTYNEDRDILVYETGEKGGTSYCQLQEYFEDIWNLSCSRTYEGKHNSANSLGDHYKSLREKYPDAFLETDWERETFAAQRITLCTNPIEPENKFPRLWQSMLQEMEKADNILIQTPYIICSNPMYQDLTDVCDGGRTVEVMINAVESGTNPFGCTDYLNQKKKVQKTGCRVYEYYGPQALHTKTFVVGDTLSMVGSCNLDMRSVYLDTEMMLFIESPELNQSLRRQIESLKEVSKQVLPDGTEIEGEHYQVTESSIGKKLMYGILRIVIIPFRHVL